MYIHVCNNKIKSMLFILVFTLNWLLRNNVMINEEIRKYIYIFCDSKLITSINKICYLDRADALNNFRDNFDSIIKI